MLASKQATVVARPTTARGVAAAPTAAAPRPASTAAALLAAATLVLAPLATPLVPAAHAAFLPDGGAEARQRLEQAEQSFQQSDTLKSLLERSEQNRDKNRRAIAAKTCARQAELGVGDCGGLKYVPGATKAGKQKTPEFLNKLLGTEGKEIEYEASGKTLEELLAADEARALKKEAEARAAKAAPAVVVVKEEAAPALE
jgi:hypothetical protein